jgi:hypothetical protein
MDCGDATTSATASVKQETREKRSGILIVKFACAERIIAQKNVTRTLVLPTVRAVRRHQLLELRLEQVLGAREVVTARELHSEL